jgi:tRNA threonylcarbamoyl adenosine modification protein YjeE
MYPTLYARYVALSQLQALAAGLADICQQTKTDTAWVIGLNGGLGAGKTALARAFLQALDAGVVEVPSPSFTLVQPYEFSSGASWLHADLYRLTTREQALGLGLLEQLEQLDGGGLLLEWPDLLADDLPPNRLGIVLDFVDGDQVKDEAGQGAELRHLEFHLHGSCQALFLPIAQLIQTHCPQHDPSNRAQQRQAFLTQAGWGDAAISAMGQDASFRRYWRLHQTDNAGAVLMDAAPPMEYVWKFDQVARLLRDVGLNVPAIYAVDDAHGFLLEEDFVQLTATLYVNGADAVQDRAKLTQVLSLAVDSLIRLHQCASLADDSGLHAYSNDRMLSDIQAFLDWYMPAVGLPVLSLAGQQQWRQAWGGTIAAQHVVPTTVILRDYHLDNLMILPDLRLGVLDFQDAMTAPLTYDLISLLEDARRDFPADVVAEQVARYLAAFPQISAQDFAQAWAAVAAVRHTRILGVFARLWHRDGKPIYLKHLPRVWGQLAAALAHPALAGLAAWFDEHVPATLRKIEPSQN